MNIALLGTGLLGSAIALRLRKAGHPLVAYNRTREKSNWLREHGVTIAGTAAEAIRGAQYVILLLADEPAIRSVLLAEPARSALAGRTVIQMGTIDPAQSQALLGEMTAAGCDYLEAPVLGSKAEARAGTLLIMVGASPEQFERSRGLFACLCREPRLIGPVGSAATLKLALNQLIAAEMAAFSLSLGLLKRGNVSLEAFMEILRESALYAPTFDKKLPRLLQGDFSNPNFSVRHMLKDVELVHRAATERGLDPRSLEGVRALLQKAIEQGLGDGDYSAIYGAINPID